MLHVLKLLKILYLLHLKMGARMTRYARYKGNSHRHEHEGTDWNDMNLSKMKAKLEEEAKEAHKIERSENRRLKRQESKKNKMVCFNCRRPGHGVEDCPEKTAGMGKKLKDRVCFICGEKDHRAMNCPSNPRGLYPEGGSCKFCGDVTHFYHACPKKLGKEENPETGEVLSTFNPMENTETLVEREKKVKEIVTVKKKPRIVRF